MRDTMVHRGPDDAGIFLSPDGAVALGHRRLSIIDLSPAGHQPMCNEDGSVWITYNGEVYNHRSLRADLERRGHHYRSRSDTETIIHLYEEQGARCMDSLHGMFAFALWDSNKRELLLVRDRIGIKPLYFTVVPGAIVFGSEIKALLVHPEVPRDLSLPALYHYMTFLVPPAPLTMFRGIYKLPAGCCLRVGSDSTVRLEQYWDALPRASSRMKDPAEASQQVKMLLKQAIEKRTMSDVPFGVFLSGGIDSSLNVALMSELMDQPVRTFSVGFREPQHLNEFEYARQVAKAFRTDHHEVVIDETDLLNFVESLIYHQDEPIADWVCVPLYFVSKLARDTGTIVVQVGEGSDEQFGGYGSYLRTVRLHERVWRPLRKAPPSLVRGAAACARRFLPTGRRGGAVTELLNLAIDEEELFWGGAICLRDSDKGALLASHAFDQMPAEEVPWQSSPTPASVEVFARLLTQRPVRSHDVVAAHLAHLDSATGGSDFLTRMMYLEFKQRLPELLLMRVDKITMSTSVEARVPFLDHELVEFTAGLPQSWKLRGGVTKRILKDAARGVIPDSIIDRRKMGFGAPVAEWLRGDLGRCVEERLRDSGLAERELFNHDRVKDMLAHHRAGRQNHALPLWLLFNLSCWYDRWIGS